MACPMTLTGIWGGRYYYFCTTGNNCNVAGGVTTASDTRSHTCGCTNGVCIDPINPTFFGSKPRSAKSAHIDLDTGHSPKVHKRNRHAPPGLAYNPSTFGGKSHNFVTATSNAPVIFDAVAATNGGRQFRLIIVAHTCGKTTTYYCFGRETNQQPDSMNNGAVLMGQESPENDHQLTVNVSQADLRNVDVNSSGQQSLPDPRALPDPVVFNCLSD